MQTRGLQRFIEKMKNVLYKEPPSVHLGKGFHVEEEKTFVNEKYAYCKLLFQRFLSLDLMP